MVSALHSYSHSAAMELKQQHHHHHHLDDLTSRLEQLLLELLESQVNMLDDDETEYISGYMLQSSSMKLTFGRLRECQLRDEIIKLYRRVRRRQRHCINRTKSLLDDPHCVWLDGAVQQFQFQSIPSFWPLFRSRFDSICFGLSISTDQTIKPLTPAQVLSKYNNSLPHLADLTDVDILEACYTPPSEFCDRFVRLVDKTVNG